MKIRVLLLRELSMLALGNAGMVQEMFIRDQPNMIIVGLSVALLMGPAVLLSWSRAKAPLPDTSESSSPSVSSLPPSG